MINAQTTKAHFAYRNYWDASGRVFRGFELRPERTGLNATARFIKQRTDGGFFTRYNPAPQLKCED